MAPALDKSNKLTWRLAGGNIISSPSSLDKWFLIFFPFFFLSFNLTPLRAEKFKLSDGKHGKNYFFFMLHERVKSFRWLTVALACKRGPANLPLVRMMVSITMISTAIRRICIHFSCIWFQAVSHISLWIKSKVNSQPFFSNVLTTDQPHGAACPLRLV